MAGEQLHEYDIDLCDYAVCNLLQYRHQPEFARWMQHRLSPGLLRYCQARNADDDPRLLPLDDREFAELAAAAEECPDDRFREWVPYEALHQRHLRCVREIREELTRQSAEEWARASARFAARLAKDRLFAGDGILIVREWVDCTRRLLQAMGAAAFLPYPLGVLPTPTCPDPPAPALPPPEAESARSNASKDKDLLAALAETQNLQREVRDLLLSQRTVKDFYSTDEIARIVGKAEFTVREWCRQRRVNAQKRRSGRGKFCSWVIAHDELLRIQREGLLPPEH